MAANTQNLITTVSSIVGTYSESTSVDDILRGIKLVNKVDSANNIYAYANTLPTANSITVGMTAYVDNDGLYICDGAQWYPLANTYTAPAWSFGGSNYGYSSGGMAPPYSNIIDKFPFATDANATDVGDLTVARRYLTGQSSTVYGYSSGGNIPPNTNVIEKFSFSTDGNSTSVGTLTVARYGAAGQSSADYGYNSGGSPTTPRTIDKFPFASDGASTYVGDQTVVRVYMAGQSSSEYGYTSGGYNPATTPTYSNVIDKFPFAADANSTGVGDLTVARNSPAGQSSSDYGYSSGGTAPPYSNVIDKFPFATDANATDVGDLTVTRRYVTGQSSTDYGYSSGGYFPTGYNVIDKFSFSADANATDVGDLTVGRYGVAGQQY
jgi:hypothetical protein